MYLRVGYVCIVFHKETKVYKICSSEDVTKEFKELGVGDSSELVNSYWVENYRSVTKFCQEKFEDKKIPQSEFFKLNKQDLKELKGILKEYKQKTNKVIREQRDARWIENLKSKRKEYSELSKSKKFFARHKNKIAAGYMIPIGCLIMVPLFALVVNILEAFGLNQYYLIVPTFAFYFWVLWINEKQDKRYRDEVIQDEDSLIQEHLKIWKSIDASTDAFEEKEDK